MQDKDKIIVELKAENERLKQELAEIGKSWGEIQEMRNANAKLKQENYTLKSGFDFQIRSNEKINKKFAKVLKYKNCLQEIKTIVKNICNGCTSECDCDEDCNYFLITEALTKAEEE